MKKLAGFGCCRMIAGFRAARRNIVYNDGGGCKYGLIPLRVMVRLNYYVVGISLYVSYISLNLNTQKNDPPVSK